MGIPSPYMVIWTCLIESYHVLPFILHLSHWTCLNHYCVTNHTLLIIEFNTILINLSLKWVQFYLTDDAINSELDNTMGIKKVKLIKSWYQKELENYPVCLYWISLIIYKNVLHPCSYFFISFLFVFVIKFIHWSSLKQSNCN